MIGALGFLSPWLLLALTALPLIWLILRLTPPRPRQVAFPPTRLLMDLEDKDRTPSRTPWWLTLIRLSLVTLLILALAEPVLRPDAKLTAGDGPLLVVFDNGWDAAPDFSERVAAAAATIAEAAREGRPVSFVATAEPQAESLAAATAAAAERRLAAIAPRPYLPDRRVLGERLRGADLKAFVEERARIDALRRAGKAPGAMVQVDCSGPFARADYLAEVPAPLSDNGC